jgi:hypothetical protein
MNAIIITIIIVTICLILISKAPAMKPGREVKSAYIQRGEEGKIAASCTVTFKENFVVAQDPPPGEIMQSFVGMYWTEIAKWADETTPVNPRKVTFS